MEVTLATSLAEIGEVREPRTVRLPLELWETLKFDYKTQGMMTEIGKRIGVVILFNKIKLHGFVAWWLWRTYYLANLPTTRKKLKVLGDWVSDLIFKPDVSMITRQERENGEGHV